MDHTSPLVLINDRQQEILRCAATLFFKNVIVTPDTERSVRPSGEEKPLPPDRQSHLAPVHMA